MKNRIAIVDGVRTPMCKAGTSFENVQADQLAAYIMKELIFRSEIPTEDISEVIFGNVSLPPHTPNIARVIALKAGLPESIPAYTVQRNCASGAESITSAADKIFAGRADVVVVGGTESMSNYPLLFKRSYTKWLMEAIKLKKVSQKLLHLFKFKLHFLSPVFSIKLGLTDPIYNILMGQTAENLAKEFHISREEQDQFALKSHEKATEARLNGYFQNEILPTPYGTMDQHIQIEDNCIRPKQNIFSLSKMKPYFDRKHGTVTVGNSCPLTDGACSLILASEDYCKKRDLKPLGYIRDYAYAGLQPQRMGLGPAFATARLLFNMRTSLKSFDLIELNEAFAAQVIANERAFASNQFGRAELNRSQALGEIDPEKLNINGGAISLGHPVGMTGARMVLTLLQSLKEKDQNLGLATLCIGGGQGGALAIERGAA
ncbi:MAG: thiolase family protein [Lentisphaeria bacterium]|nr:thiolase family protein [Lentisphaeria bacterium]